MFKGSSVHVTSVGCSYGNAHMTLCMYED